MPDCSFSRPTSGQLIPYGLRTAARNSTDSDYLVCPESRKINFYQAGHSKALMITSRELNVKTLWERLTSLLYNMYIFLHKHSSFTLVYCTLQITDFSLEIEGLW